MTGNGKWIEGTQHRWRAVDEPQELGAEATGGAETDDERAVEALWRAVLDLPPARPVGRLDSFTNVGGSLVAAGGSTLRHSGRAAGIS